MTASVTSLTTLSEAQRAFALSRFAIIRLALEEGISQAQVACTHQIVASTVQSWIKRYRELVCPDWRSFWRVPLNSIRVSVLRTRFTR